MTVPSAFAYAVLFDTLHRSWPSALHPVAWFGRAAEKVQTVLYQPSDPPLKQLLKGAALVLISVVGSLLAVFLLKAVVPRSLRVGVDTLLLAASFTITGLIRAADQVRIALEHHDLRAARTSLQSLCSRDASTLTASELTAATVESVAENTSDSWVAPMFWYIVAGLPGAIAYRAINTLDAMYGYRGRYEWFGKAAARLDDALNFVPARLTALLFWLVSPEHGWGQPEVWRIWHRDRNQTASPNAGQTMAMMAALLRVQLSKAGHYQLGDPTHPLTSSTIVHAGDIARRAGWVMVVLVVMIRGIL